MNVKTIQAVLFGISLMSSPTGINQELQASAVVRRKISDYEANAAAIAQIYAGREQAAAHPLNSARRLVPRDPDLAIDDTAAACLYRLWPGLTDAIETFASFFDICKVV